MGRYNEILEVARRGDFRREDRRFSKEDLFGGDPAPIGVRSVLEEINSIVEMLADQGEFITEREWLEQRFGSEKNLSLRQIADHYGNGLSFKNGYVCNDETEDKVPKERAEFEYIRNAQLEPATEDDNVEFWDACDDGHYERAYAIWQAKEIDLEYMHEGHWGSGKYTPLMAAVNNESEFVSRFLLDVGANPDAVAQSGETALMLAADNSNNDLVAMLINDILNHYHGNCQKQHEALTREDSNDYNALETVEDHCEHETIEKLTQVIRDSERGIDNSTPKIRKSFMPPPEVFEPNKKLKSESEAALTKHGDSITREALLKAGWLGKKSLLRKTIEGGNIGKALEILRTSGERLTKEDLLRQEAGEETSNIEQIAQQGQLPILFAADNWVNNVREMQEVWARVPRRLQVQMDGRDGRPSFKHAFHEANAASVKALQTSTRAVGDR